VDAGDIDQAEAMYSRDKSCPGITGKCFPTSSHPKEESNTPTFQPSTEVAGER